MLSSFLLLSAITSKNKKFGTMSTTESPPDYCDPVTVSEKPIIAPEKPHGPTAYHITLQRCKRNVKLASGRYCMQGIIEDQDVAITIKPNEHWPEIRKKIFHLYQQAWPAQLSKANVLDDSLAVSVQYSTWDGEVYGRISLLELENDGLWEFLRRDDIHVINLVASSAPRRGDAPGQIRRSQRRQTIHGLEVPRGEKVESKHRCVLQ
jgi:hypothetical protein